VLLEHWAAFVLSQQVAVVVAARTVRIGDHTYVVSADFLSPGIFM
jgi:hypothetical protein